MTNLNRIFALTVLVVIMSGLFAVGAKPEGESSAPASRHDPVSRLLADFAGAVSALDVEKAESLFLPPDDTADGTNRREHIREMKKDWNRERDREAEMSVQFTNTTVLVETEMIVGGEEAEPHPIPVRFKITFDPKGNCKIVSMEYVKE